MDSRDGEFGELKSRLDAASARDEAEYTRIVDELASKDGEIETLEASRLPMRFIGLTLLPFAVSRRRCGSCRRTSRAPSSS